MKTIILNNNCFSCLAVLETNSATDGSSAHRMSKNGGSSTLGYAPDLTSGVHNEYTYTYSDKNSNCSSQKAPGINGHSTPIPMVAFSDFRPMSEHFYEQPHALHHQKNNVETSSNGMMERSPFFVPVSTATEQTPFFQEQKSSATSSNGQPSPTTTFSSVSRMTAVSGTPGTFSKNVSYQNMNWATVTETGTRITVPQSTVTLTIPQGAVPAGRTHDIYVAVLNQEKSGLCLDSTAGNPVTPMVQWGIGNNPRGFRPQLHKPVVLSMPHHTSVQKEATKVFHCSDVEVDNAEWSVLNNSDNLQVDPNFVHLVTEKTGSFILVQDTIMGHLNTYANVQSTIMSNSTKQALCRCLDVPTCQGNDWRKLAEVVGANHYSAHFANQPSPSEAILNLWEARNNFKDNKSALTALAQLLRDINRPDAIVILERELK